MHARWPPAISHGYERKKIRPLWLNTNRRRITRKRKASEVKANKVVKVKGAREVAKGHGGVEEKAGLTFRSVSVSWVAGGADLSEK